MEVAINDNLVLHTVSIPGESGAFEVIKIPDDLAKHDLTDWAYNPETKALTPPPEYIEKYKLECIERISTKADDYQDKIIGTGNTKRAKRFEANLKAAKALFAGIETDAQREMLQMQLDANTYAGHPVLKTATLEEFAGWVAGYDELTTKAIGLIENVLIVGRAQVQKAETVEQIDAIMDGLETQAAEQFAALVSGAGA